MKTYDIPNDLAIKAANWAMKEDLACAVAHQAMRTARQDLVQASRDDVPSARAVYQGRMVEAGDGCV
jgi:hypothetical protein